MAEEFCSRSLSALEYPVLWIDALYEKVRSGGKDLQAAIVVCAANGVLRTVIPRQAKVLCGASDRVAARDRYSVAGLYGNL